MAGILEGKVVSIDATGNLITDIPTDSLCGLPNDRNVTVTCDGHSTVGIFPQDHGQPEMTLLALLGSSGRLELSLVGESASEFLCVRVGAPVVVQW